MSCVLWLTWAKAQNKSPSEDQETEEAQTVKPRTTWPASRATNTVPQRNGKHSLTTVPQLTEQAYFLWNTGAAREQATLIVSLEGDMSSPEQDMTLRKGREVGNKNHARISVRRSLWRSSGLPPRSKQGHDIKVMTLAPRFHCSKLSQSTLASVSIPTCKIELNRLIEFHHHRNEVKITISCTALQLQPCSLHNSLI